MGYFRFDDFNNSDQDFSGNDLIGVPKNQFTAGFMFNLSYGFDLEADYFLVDKIPLNDTNALFTDSYSLCNAALN